MIQLRTLINSEPGDYVTSGIYSIKNVLNGDEYVGSSKNIEGRVGGHRRALKRGDHGNPRLQRAWNKYGHEAFEFVTLEKTLDLGPREMFYIETRNSKYNIMKVIDRVWTLSDEHRAAITRALKGRPLSKAHCQALKEACKPRKGKPLSEAHRVAIGKALRGKPFSEGHREGLRKAWEAKRKGK